MLIWCRTEGADDKRLGIATNYVDIRRKRKGLDLGDDADDLPYCDMGGLVDRLGGGPPLRGHALRRDGPRYGAHAVQPRRHTVGRRRS